MAEKTIAQGARQRQATQRAAISVHHQSLWQRPPAWGLFLTLPCMDLSSPEGHGGRAWKSFHPDSPCCSFVLFYSTNQGWILVLVTEEPLDTRACLRCIAQHQPASWSIFFRLIQVEDARIYGSVITFVLWIVDCVWATWSWARPCVLYVPPLQSLRSHG